MSSWTATPYTDVGLKRSINEDALIDNSPQLLWAVADGMGGHSAGDYASQHVVAALSRYQHQSKPGFAMGQLKQLLADCNRHLFEKAIAEQLGTVGCTVAALTIHENFLFCSWSGDSRVYRLRGGELLQLTRDHSHQSLSEDRNQLLHNSAAPVNGELLTAAVGGESALHLEHCWFALEPHDQFLLCTDGLYKEVTDEEIHAVFTADSGTDTLVATLSRMYRERGARDNLGMIHVFLPGQSNPL